MIAPRKILTDEMVAKIEALAPRYPNRRALTLPALHIVNAELRHVPLQAVAEIAAVLGLAPAEVQDTLTFYQREVIYDIFETLCGARFTNSYTRVGGVSQDFTPLVIEKIRTFVKTFPKTLDDMERLLTRNRIFVDRTKGVGVLTKDEAINRSASGPVARASGVTRDLRKDEPYLAYADLDFKIACASAGDCYARYLVRMQEMRESLKIVAQALEHLPGGPVNVGIDQRTALPTKQQVYSSIEGTISHFELSMANRGFEVPFEESYAAIEAPNGELGFYIVGDGDDTAYRARCRPPSVLHFALFPFLIRGHTLSDVVAVLGSLNIIAAELDR